MLSQWLNNCTRKLNVSAHKVGLGPGIRHPCNSAPTKSNAPKYANLPRYHHFQATTSLSANAAAVSTPYYPHLSYVNVTVAGRDGITLNEQMLFMD